MIPTEPDDFSQLAQKATDLVSHLAALPLNDLTKDANNLFAELALTAKAFQKVAKNLDQVLADTTQQATVRNLNNTLQSVAGVADDFAAGSKNYHELTNTLMLLQESLQELKPILRQVNNKPNSLIFSTTSDDSLAPVKHAELKKN